MLIKVLVVVIFCGYSKGLTNSHITINSNQYQITKRCNKEQPNDDHKQSQVSVSEVPTCLDLFDSLYRYHISPTSMSATAREENNQVGWSVKLLEVRDGDDHQQVKKHSPC